MLEMNTKGAEAARWLAANEGKTPAGAQIRGSKNAPDYINTVCNVAVQLRLAVEHFCAPLPTFSANTDSVKTRKSQSLCTKLHIPSHKRFKPAWLWFLAETFDPDVAIEPADALCKQALAAQVTSPLFFRSASVPSLLDSPSPPFVLGASGSLLSA